MRPLLLLAVLAAPAAALAAGTTPPVQTQTSKDCTASQVWDAAKKTCVDARESGLPDATLMQAAHELSSFGRPQDALAVLDALASPGHPDALTLRGFAARKAGDHAAAFIHYEAALALDPAHILARSYMGQGLAEAGQLDAARTQLALIRDAGGRGTWPEISLARLLETGKSTY